MVTLRYIIKGTSQIDLAGMFRISPTSVGRIINETSIAIWTILLVKEYISYPKSENECKAITNEFEKWNFSICIGAIDAKHIVMQTPSRSGSFYFNYKKSHSIVLMTIYNANYEFTLIDVPCRYHSKKLKKAAYLL
nr:uncharacterized protein LOC124811244 [Hydra vulgaris]